jgi:hypothetical protein
MPHHVTTQEVSPIDEMIFTIRGMQVMLDRDLASLYGVETKVFNQAVKRNNARFPSDFMFQLSVEEKSELVTNCDRLDKLKHSSVNPYVFTEQGVSMLSAILKSDRAIEMSIEIVRAFVQMRKVISNNALIFDKFDKIEQKLLKHDDKFEEIFKAIEAKDIKPKQGIFFDGQIYDAYIFVSDLIKSAKSSIVLIDNYIDESTLTLLSKRDKKIDVTIYTKNISKTLQLDLKKYNTQYPKIEIKKFELSHDRFLIIDKKKVYHIGASLKDLGKKWFAFSLMDENSIVIIDKIGEMHGR